MKTICLSFLLLSFFYVLSPRTSAFAEAPHPPSNMEVIRDSNVNNTETYGYRSGRSRYQPSPGVHQSPVRPTPPPAATTPARTGGFFSHLGAFGAGALLGSMFHPFGGGFGGMGFGYPSFSLLGFALDIILIVLVFSLIRRLFQRRY
jgi:hypothetical protein